MGSSTRLWIPGHCLHLTVLKTSNIRIDLYKCIFKQRPILTSILYFFFHDCSSMSCINYILLSNCGFLVSTILFFKSYTSMYLYSNVPAEVVCRLDQYCCTDDFHTPLHFTDHLPLFS